jgi:amino acid permease
MARERVLPELLGKIGSGAKAGVPVGGSVLQSAIAAVVVAAFVAVGQDPVTGLFTLLSTLAALGILLLMVGTSLAVRGFFAQRSDHGATAWQRTGAPVLGAAALLVVLVVTVVNIGSVLATDNAVLKWSLPALVVVVAIAGVAWGMILRETRPEVYEGIGAGQAKPLAVLSHTYADIEI